MYDAGISASDEEQLDLFNRLDVLVIEVIKPVEFIAKHTLKYPVHCKRPTKGNSLTQLSLLEDAGVIGGIIELDKGLRLKAPNPNSLNNDLVLADNIGGDAAKILLDYMWKGFQKYAKEKLPIKTRVSKCVYRPILDYLLANHLNACNQQSQILYSRSTSNGNEKLIRVVSYLVHTKMISNKTAAANEYDGITSFMWPTIQLQSKLERAKVQVGLNDGAEVLELRERKRKRTRTVGGWVKTSEAERKATGKERKWGKVKEQYWVEGKKIPIKTGKKTKRLLNERLSAPVNAFNKMMNDHEVTLYGVELLPYCKRIFTASRELDLGGRFYNKIQSHSKAARSDMLIDGEKVVEPDFKSLHPCMLYAWEGIPLDPNKNSPYVLKSDKFSRDTVKRCWMKFTNSQKKTMGAFRANITKSGNKDIQEHVKEYGVLRARYERDYELGNPATEPRKGHLHRGYVEGLPIGINGGELAKEIEEAHLPIKGQMNKPDIGLKLQFADSQIMARILTKVSREDIPVQPVHDSLMCKESDQARVEEIMLESYFEELGFDGFIG